MKMVVGYQIMAWSSPIHANYTLTEVNAISKNRLLGKIPKEEEK